MMFSYRSTAVRERIHPCSWTLSYRPERGEDTMRWETPRATEFRFGMEITLYIANR